MSSAQRRLDKVEASLTPKQQVLCWLDRMVGFGARDGYLEWLSSQPVSEMPRVKLPEVVADAVRGALRGEPDVEIDRAVQDAVRDVLFLTKLAFDLDALVEEKCREFDLRAALCARGLQLLLVQEALGRRGTGAVALPGGAGRVREVRDQVEALLEEACEARHAVGAVAERYFDGHPVAFPKGAHRLDMACETGETIVAEYNRVAARQTADGLAVDVDAVKRAAAARAVETTRRMANLAWADAQWEVGRVESAARLMRACTDESQGTREG